MKKQFLFSPIIACISVISLSGCYYDIEDKLYPKINCDTTNITYSSTVISILQNGACLSCHGGTASAGGNIILDTYDGLKAYAQNGHLMGSLKQEAGFSAMPLGGNKLNSCDINKLTAWISAGFPNN